MKAYGIPRNHDIDSKEYAPRSADRNIPGLSGRARSSFKNADSKRATRRIYKGRARRAARAEIQEALHV